VNDELHASALALVDELIAMGSPARGELVVPRQAEDVAAYN